MKSDSVPEADEVPAPSSPTPPTKTVLPEKKPERKSGAPERKSLLLEMATSSLQSSRESTPGMRA